MFTNSYIVQLFNYSELKSGWCLLLLPSILYCFWLCRWIFLELCRWICDALPLTKTELRFYCCWFIAIDFSVSSCCVWFKCAHLRFIMQTITWLCKNHVEPSGVVSGHIFKNRQNNTYKGKAPKNTKARTQQWSIISYFKRIQGLIGNVQILKSAGE